MSLRQDLFATYSIVARDAQTGQLGVAVQTHQMCVGSRIIWMLPGVGAMITQSLSNISYGPMALAMLREGIEPEKIIAGLTATDKDAHRRQAGVVDAQGRGAAWTGSGCIREASHHVGKGFTVHANMMTRPTVVPAMVRAYETASGDLAARLMAALEAAQAEDGDIRGMQSAALKIVSGDITKPAWDADFDLRVDEHETPLVELARLVRMQRANVLDNQGYEVQAGGDMDRALDLWAQARAEAPEMEEIPYWQALTLADNTGDIEGAAAIMRSMLQDHRRDEWLDLIERLVQCGIVEHADRAEALLNAVR